MLSILLVFFQALARAEVQRIRTPPQLLGEFRGNKHATHGIASHFSAMRCGGGRRVAAYPPRSECEPGANGIETRDFEPSP